ncbi:MAG: glycosyltransferase family 2 protein [Streptococcaceae bacterium]|jgi:glycosyltransferase involved in cell wall biosynthesis|nr:glycosyltransferase family 2 protein [Streptococcaceae bacterium]
MGTDKIKLTIFTPTFNRADTIGRLFESLKKQTCFDFEWLVIDDGSVDETERLFEKWCQEDLEFNIIYQKVENGGKHRAFNKGVKIAAGDCFFNVDSDDFLSNDAVEKILNWIKMIDDEEDFIGIAGLMSYENGKLVGTTFDSEKSYVDATMLELERFNITGDRPLIFKKSILEKYPFIEFEGENFMSEGDILQRIAMDGYKFRWFNEVIYLGEYLPDGLTNQGKSLYQKNPKGYIHVYSLKANYKEPSKSSFQNFHNRIYYANKLSSFAVENGISEEFVCEQLRMRKNFLSSIKIIYSIRTLFIKD